MTAQVDCLTVLKVRSLTLVYCQAVGLLGWLWADTERENLFPCPFHCLEVSSITTSALAYIIR